MDIWKPTLAQLRLIRQKANELMGKRVAVRATTRVPMGEPERNKDVTSSFNRHIWGEDAETDFESNYTLDEFRACDVELDENGHAYVEFKAYEREGSELGDLIDYFGVYAKKDGRKVVITDICM